MLGILIGAVLGALCSAIGYASGYREGKRRGSTFIQTKLEPGQALVVQIAPKEAA